MRNAKRIPILLDIYARESVREAYLKNVVGLAQKSDIKKYLAKWEAKTEEIEKIWEECPDLRMSQVLIAANVLPNFSGSWFYMEDERFMEQSGIADRRMTTIWVKKDGDLPEKGIPLKNISDKDLEIIQKEMGEKLPSYLLTEIEYRADKDVKVNETNNPYYILDID